MKQFKHTLVELLSIQGPSGKESKVAAYLMKRLSEVQFDIRLDRYGNVLAEKRYGSGPVIVLSAHMDTVLPFEPNRKLIWDGDILRSSSGILGADDRAGIAIILEVIRLLELNRPTGTIKLAFTRDEEVGRLGSNAISPKWLRNVDMAIVADRRNRRDIVTSCRYMDFCSEAIGAYWERIGRQVHQPDWTICQGGISDALTFAEHGIPSVNLSCGYQHEHTEFEELHWPSALDCAVLIAEGVQQWRSNKPIIRADQAAMHELTTALKKRGFMVTHSGNTLLLPKCSSVRERKDLQEILNSIHIPSESTEQGLLLTSFRWQPELAEHIQFFKGYNSESWFPQHIDSWKTFTKRRHGLKLNTLHLDPAIAYLVKQLSAAGIITVMSCDGHGRRAPSIWFSGCFSAAWFELIAQKILTNAELNYRWMVKADQRGQRILTAIQSDRRPWDLTNIQADAVMIGEWFEQHADELSQFRRNIFKYRSMKAHACHLSENYEQLKAWMQSCLDLSEIKV